MAGQYFSCLFTKVYTIDCLETVRELKNLGIGVYFEEQNIDTAQMSGELLTTVFAAISQKESESISQNMKWSYQRRMESGEFITCKAPFGYRLKQGKLEIDESEAQIVRQKKKRYRIICHRKGVTEV